MSVVIRPKSYNEAYSFLVSVPFYSLKDFFSKAPLVFKEDEIASVRKREEHFFIHYKRKDFYGSFYTFCFDNNDYLKYSKASEPNDNVWLLLKDTLFSVKNPVIWLVAYYILIRYVFSTYG